MAKDDARPPRPRTSTSSVPAAPPTDPPAPESRRAASGRGADPPKLRPHGSPSAYALPPSSSTSPSSAPGPSKPFWSRARRCSLRETWPIWWRSTSLMPHVHRLRSRSLVLRVRGWRQSGRRLRTCVLAHSDARLGPHGALGSLHTPCEGEASQDLAPVEVDDGEGAVVQLLVIASEVVPQRARCAGLDVGDTEHIYALLRLVLVAQIPDRVVDELAVVEGQTDVHEVGRGAPAEL